MYKQYLQEIFTIAQNIKNRILSRLLYPNFEKAIESFIDNQLEFNHSLSSNLNKLLSSLESKQYNNIEREEYEAEDRYALRNQKEKE